jgi:hypothetical protein
LVLLWGLELGAWNLVKVRCGRTGKKRTHRLGRFAVGGLSFMVRLGDLAGPP